MPVRPIVSLSLAIAVATLGGCGERREAGGTVRTTPPAVGAQPAKPGAAVATIDVSLADYRLTPGDPYVAREGIIAFVVTNDGQTPHALAVDGPTGELRTVTLRPGERTTVALRLPPGSYKWYCPIADHERRGMVGRVRVAE